MMTKRLAIVALVLSAMTPGARVVFAQHGSVMTWSVDGVKRSGIVFAPVAPSEGGAAPLVFSFHGHGDWMQSFQRTDMHVAWPQAMVVYFQGFPARDGLSGWQVEKGQDGDRDLKLVDVALASLREKFKIDDRRVYATGFSNGANFTYLLWAERPGVFAAYAPVAARLRPSVHPTEPRPVFHIAGRLDATIPFAAQQEAIDVAKGIDGAGESGASCGDGCTRFDSGSATVMTWIHSGGHQYPSTTSERIAAFFRDHPRQP